MSKGGASIVVVFCTAALAVLIAVSGCERDEAEQSVDEPTPAVDGREDGDDEPEVSTDSGSIYDQELHVEPLEPVDIGPEAPALYFVSGLKGYTEPCGCTVDVLLGGIDRITAFIKDASRLHERAIFVDAGDWLFETSTVPEHMEPQERAKAEVLAAAHRRMGTLFSVPGNRDLALGVEFYESKMADAQMTPLGANLRFNGEELAASMIRDFGDHTLLFVAAGDPSTYDGIDGVEATGVAESIRPIVEKAEQEVVILVFQGDRYSAEEVVRSVDGIDFVLVGHEPQREVDARAINGTHLLEAYDQGRYVGRLKLYGHPSAGSFRDSRRGFRDQRLALDEQIRQVRQDLRTLQVRTDDEETALSQRLRQRLEGLKTRREELMRQGFEIDDRQQSFLYDLIAMEPGYRLDEEISKRREAYNIGLAELNAKIEREVIPVADGDPFYVGTRECATCHLPAHQFWEETAHASAVATLEKRHKQYDQNCIGCHVVGWEEPGGSVLGKISYEAELGDRVFDKDLSEVGCESCHGPGSQHVLEPVDTSGSPQHIETHPTEVECTQCHVPDHSPNFDFAVYVERITGEGHQYGQ